MCGEAFLESENLCIGSNWFPAIRSPTDELVTDSNRLREFAGETIHLATGEGSHKTDLLQDWT